MGKAYGRLPTELMRDTDFRYALNEIVLDIGSEEDQAWEIFLATGKRQMF